MRCDWWPTPQRRTLRPARWKPLSRTSEGVCSVGPAPFRTHRAPFPIPRVFAFQAPEWLLVHLDWVLSSCQACPLSLAGKEALRGRRDGRAGEEGETEATVFLDDLQVCRGVRGTSGLLATVPFPCVPLRDMQLFKAVAVGRMETDPEAPQNPERWSPPSPQLPLWLAQTPALLLS